MIYEDLESYRSALLATQSPHVHRAPCDTVIDVVLHMIDVLEALRDKQATAVGPSVARPGDHQHDPNGRIVGDHA